MPVLRPLCLAALLLAAAGCGSSDRVQVTGTVKLDGEPLPDATVTFYPEGETGGLGGSGRTGPDGTYTLTDARGGNGILSGNYRVIVSWLRNPDGSAPDPAVPPIESQARENLPAVYSDRNATTLRARVSQDDRGHDFALQRPRKGR
jgi:hypothetical protein